MPSNISMCSFESSAVEPLLPELAVVLPRSVLKWTTDEIVEDLCLKNDVQVMLLRRTDTHLFVRCSSLECYHKLKACTFLGMSKARTFLSLRILRCFMCGQLGHKSDSCPEEKPLCMRCGSPAHKSEACSAPNPECVLCKKVHASTDFRCPALRRAQDYRRSRMQL